MNAFSRSLGLTSRCLYTAMFVGAMTTVGVIAASPASAENYLVLSTKNFNDQHYINTDWITQKSTGFEAWRLNVHYGHAIGYRYAYVLEDYYCEEQKVIAVAHTSYDETWSVVDEYSGGTTKENVEPGDFYDRLMRFVCAADDKRTEHVILDAPQDLSETLKMAKELSGTLHYDDETQALMPNDRGTMPVR